MEPNTIEVYAWSDAVRDYVLVYSGTDDQEAKKARRSFLNKQTRARNKRKKLISEIIREEGIHSYEDALDYLENLVNGGKVAAVLLEYMEADKGHWELEIMRTKKEREEKENAGKDGN